MKTWSTLGQFVEAACNVLLIDHPHEKHNIVVRPLCWIWGHELTRSDFCDWCGKREPRVRRCSSCCLVPGGELDDYEVILTCRKRGRHPRTGWHQDPSGTWWCN